MKNASASLKLLFCCLVSASTQIYSNPQTPTIVAGDVSFNQPDQQTLIVNSNSSRSIIDWDQFSIDLNESTTFNLDFAKFWTGGMRQ